MRSDSNLKERFVAEGVDTRDYGSMPGVLDTSTRVEGRGRVARSHSFSGHETNSLFMNEGGRAFADWSALSRTDSLYDGRGFAYLDYDRDGWVDIALVNSNAPQFELFRNRMGALGATGRAIRVRLVGARRSAEPARERLSPRDGTGAHVVVSVGGRALRREARLGDGFAAQNSQTLLIGIGPRESVDGIAVLWPSGRESRVGTTPAGALVTVHEDAGDSGQGAVEVAMPEAARPPTGRRPPFSLAEWKPLLPASEARLRVIVTMATWCKVCRGELPHLADLRAALPPGEVSLIGFPIDPEDTAETLAHYVTEAKPAYTLLESTTAADQEWVKQLLVEHLGEAVLPATVVVDARGSVVRIRKGIPTLSEVRRLLALVP
ncbi:MAG: ASPIC/UnbV domain-containing protein [Verrucomicrobiales bacterium]